MHTLHTFQMSTDNKYPTNLMQMKKNEQIIAALNRSIVFCLNACTKVY